jgi:hypothetical protein
MSNSRHFRRNMNVLTGMLRAEVETSGPGSYHGTVRHDRGCPGLRYQSMRRCRCNPEVEISKVSNLSIQASGRLSARAE